MGIIQKWKARREIRKILESNDKEKLESVKDYNKDENLENIILSIQDKQRRAEALQKAIHKIEDKEVLKSIIPTLKDDDILIILEKKPEYIENDTINILYTTISGIIDPEKRIEAVKKFYKKLSDQEVSNLLISLKDSKIKSGVLESEEYGIENAKIRILTNKIIDNYITRETLLHMRELLGCLELEMSKVKVVEEALKQQEKLQEKIKKGELPEEYEKFDRLGNRINIKNSIFDIPGIKSLIKKSFENIYGTKSVEKRKKEAVIKLYKQNVYSYEEARDALNNGIHNESIIKEGKNNLLRIEGRKKFVQEVQDKDLIDTPITIEETGKIVDISDEINL